MDGKWTFTCEEIRGWTASLFDTRDEAVKKGKELFPDAKYLQVGQIQSFCGTDYIENREYV